MMQWAKILRRCQCDGHLTANNSWSCLVTRRRISATVRRRSSLFKVSAKSNTHPQSSRPSPYTLSPEQRDATDNLKRLLIREISENGPITVARFMKTALTHPKWGYYMTRDVFGPRGDFTTSPEISQLFGELIGVWCASESKALLEGLESLQIIELGPGRGTLMADILRVLTKIGDATQRIDLKLVEVSDAMRALQYKMLVDADSDFVLPQTSHVYNLRGASASPSSSMVHQVTWHDELADVPDSPSLFIVHEFLDAMPVRKFTKTESGWREILIDFEGSNLSPGGDETAESDSNPFYFIISDDKPTLEILDQLKERIAANPSRSHIELSENADIVVNEIIRRLESNSGAALIADYGHIGEKRDTFRAFRSHSIHDPLVQVGTADLTADVDFAALNRTAQAYSHLTAHGPISQRRFLRNMGIELRLQMLALNATDPAARLNLASGFDMLINPLKMGERFKFIAYTSSIGAPRDHVPVGFKPPSA